MPDFTASLPISTVFSVEYRQPGGHGARTWMKLGTAEGEGFLDFLEKVLRVCCGGGCLVGRIVGSDDRVDVLLEIGLACRVLSWSLPQAVLRRTAASRCCHRPRCHSRCRGNRYPAQMRRTWPGFRYQASRHHRHRRSRSSFSRPAGMRCSYRRHRQPRHRTRYCRPGH